MLRRNLELTADVMLAELLEERVGFIGHDVIIAQAGTHEDLLHLRQRADFAQQLDIVRVVDRQIRTGFGKRHCLLAHVPNLNCFWQDAWRKLAVGPPTSWI